MFIVSYKIDLYNNAYGKSQADTYHQVRIETYGAEVLDKQTTSFNSESRTPPRTTNDSFSQPYSSKQIMQ